MVREQMAGDRGGCSTLKRKREEEEGMYGIAVMVHEPAVLIEGVLFRARYLGSTQLTSEGRPSKTTRMTQVTYPTFSPSVDQMSKKSKRSYVSRQGLTLIENRSEVAIALTPRVR